MVSPPKGFTEKLNTPPQIGIIYARYSSHNQKDLSIEQQVEKCIEYARQNSISIIDTYSDRAVSGKTDLRPAFQRMMKDADKKKFVCVVAWKSNRMGRNMLQAMLNEVKLRENGVRAYYVEESFEDNAAGRFALRSMMNVNQFYSENLAEDTMRGMLDNASRCMVNGPLPFGFKKGNDGRYSLDEEQAPIVREIFMRVAEGEAFIAIANELNSRGITTSRGNLWNKNSFHTMLKNEFYIGVYKFADIRIEGGIPSTIEKELFYKVQDYLKNKKNPQGKRSGGVDYLLTGKLFCGHCEAPMTGISGTSKNGELHHYYVCKSKQLDKTCSKKNVRRDYLEQAIAEKVVEDILRDDVMAWIADNCLSYAKRLSEDSEIKANEKALIDVQKSIKNIMNAIEQGIITPTTKTRLITLEQEQAELEISISLDKADIPVFNREQIIFWLDSFRKGDITSKNQQDRIISSFVSSVYLYDNDEDDCYDVEIVFGYDDSGKSAHHTLAKTDVDTAPDNMYNCSYKLPSGSPPHAADRAGIPLFYLPRAELAPRPKPT